MSLSIGVNVSPVGGEGSLGVVVVVVALNALDPTLFTAVI